MGKQPKKLLSSRSPIVVEGAEPCRPPIRKTLVFGTGGLAPTTTESRNLQARDSPDFNPIEKAFSKLKAFLKKTAARTVDDLWEAIAKGIDTFTHVECHNYFAAAGYDRE